MLAGLQGAAKHNGCVGRVEGYRRAKKAGEERYAVRLLPPTESARHEAQDSESDGVLPSARVLAVRNANLRPWQLQPAHGLSFKHHLGLLRRRFGSSGGPFMVGVDGASVSESCVVEGVLVEQSYMLGRMVEPKANRERRSNFVVLAIKLEEVATGDSAVRRTTLDLAASLSSSDSSGPEIERDRQSRHEGVTQGGGLSVSVYHEPA